MKNRSIRRSCTCTGGSVTSISSSCTVKAANSLEGGHTRAMGKFLSGGEKVYITYQNGKIVPYSTFNTIMILLGQKLQARGWTMITNFLHERMRKKTTRQVTRIKTNRGFQLEITLLSPRQLRRFPRDLGESIIMKVRD